MAPSRLAPQPATEVGVAAAALLGAAALGRLVTGGGAGGAVPALLGAALVGVAVPALLRRTRMAPALAAVVATVAVVAVAVWSAALDAAGRLPTASAFGKLPAEVRSARAELASFHLPLHAGPGIVLLGALLCGLAGMAARLLLGPLGTRRPRLHPALALVPAAALVAWSCLAEAGDGAALLSAALVAASALALAGPAERAGRWPGRRVVPWRGGLALLVAALAVGTTVGVGIPLGTGPVGGAASRVPATALSLTTDLVGIEHRDPKEVLFWARSPVPTYWQVGVLTVWRDDHWVAGAGDALAATGSVRPTAPQLPGSPASRRFTASVTIAALSGRLLPVPPSTVSVSAPGALVGADGVVAPSSSRPGDAYRATALSLAVGSATTGTSAGLLPATLASLDALPAVPQSVVQLAHQVTATATSPLAQAEELVNWFRSGRYRYTLTPPAAPQGTNPLVAFLDVTRAGTCESFAGAFAVMARSLGLPTRVAVGFTDGRPAADGTTAITGGDAHAWPEVYLGSALGWVSFEPTPEQATGSVAPPDVVGPTITALPTPAVTTPTTPAAVPTTPAVTTPSAAPTTSPSPGSHATTPPSPGPSSGARRWWLAAVPVALLGAVWATSRRRRRRRDALPEQRVVAAYRAVERDLARAGIARSPHRTPTSHARALLEASRRWRSLDRGPAADQLLAALLDLCDLAQRVERSGYDPRPTTPAEAGAAEAAAGRIARALRRPPVRSVAAELTRSAAGAGSGSGAWGAGTR